MVRVSIVTTLTNISLFINQLIKWQVLIWRSLKNRNLLYGWFRGVPTMITVNSIKLRPTFTVDTTFCADHFRIKKVRSMTWNDEMRIKILYTIFHQKLHLLVRYNWIISRIFDFTSLYRELSLLKSCSPRKTASNSI